ncbi:MAG: class I SAM-dependent methyltransferase [Acidobacteriia bacterium]|nr:class I SAM-dependent methyltransferase [Terriglobia bacterium]
MAKQGEIDYLKNIGDAGVRHAINKPFSDPDCDRFLIEFGLVLSLLPPPPARLLDLGCGTGWTSVLFARRGYDVVGVDISSDMIEHAGRNPDARGLANLRFQVSDYEDLRFAEEFDCAVFFDALHHAVDEKLAVERTYAALKPGGACVASEPGKGHQDAESSREAVKKWNVTEKDMHPDKIIALARAAGFREFKVYPHLFDMSQVVAQSFDSNAVPAFDPAEKPSLKARVKERLVPLPKESPALRRMRYSETISALVYMLASVGNTGVVRMIK